MSDGWVHFGDGKYEKFLDTPIPAGQIQNMDDLMVILEAAFTFFVRHIMKRTGTLEPVSYTHLDVYKRQRCGTSSTSRAC